MAVKSYVLGLTAVSHDNDWAAAVPHLKEATTIDETFALAQFLYFSILQTLGDNEGASAAIAMAMEYLYRVPERIGFMIKAQYYYNEKQDADKALAVLNMWTKIYPNDIAAYNTQATFLFIRQDIAGAIVAYERILEIDPSQVEVLDSLADFHAQLGHYDEAEKYLKQYIAIFPTRADGYEDLADFYSGIGRLSEAREVLTEAQLIEPGNTDLALGIINLDLKDGKYQQCAGGLSDLLRSDPTPSEEAQIILYEIKLARRQGHTGKIVERLEAYYALSLELQNPLQANIVYTMMLPSVSTAGQPDLALVRLGEIRALIPQPYDDLVGVGEAWALAESGQPAAATAKLTAAVAIVDMLKFETYRPTITMVEGMIAEADGDLAGAAQLYQNAVESALRGKANYRIRLARAQRLLGQEEAAHATIADALLVDPAHPRFQLELAQLLYTQGDLVGAQQKMEFVLAAWASADDVFKPAQEAQRLADLLATP